MALAAVLASLTALALTPQQKASLVVVSPLRNPGTGGLFVQRWSRERAWPSDALVFTDQEGGAVRTFPQLPPWRAASSYTSNQAAYAAGLETGRALHRTGIDVDLAPVLDSAGGPLGSRHFRRSDHGVAFARGLLAGGTAPCAKHFPGLGTARASTDAQPHVNARVRAAELASFRAAVRAGAPCVMTSNAFYDGARFRASISPDTYRRLRALGFRGVAITDSLSIVRRAPVERWARQAVRAGADLVLFTSPAHARRAVAALVPLARAGELDAHVRRVLAFRARYG